MMWVLQICVDGLADVFSNIKVKWSFYLVSQQCAVLLTSLVKKACNCNKNGFKINIISSTDHFCNFSLISCYRNTMDMPFLFLTNLNECSRVFPQLLQREIQGLLNSFSGQQPLKFKELTWNSLRHKSRVITVTSLRFL